MTERESNSEREQLSNLVRDYRRALSALQDLTEEFAARLRSGTLDASDAHPNTAADRRGVLELTCLGAFSVRYEGRVLELPTSGRPSAILKVLADRGGRPLSRDQLIELLWPGVPTEAGANRLRVAVHALRQAFGAGIDLVEFEGGAYRLRADRIELDVERFEALIEEGRRLAQDNDVEGARARFEAAERLYGGDYFQDDPFEEWATTRRQHLRDLYLNLLVKLALFAMERADYDACVGYGHAIVREDALSEDAYRLLMLAHARLGNRARALRWYELCKQALRRELNLAPSAATERLRDEILSEEANAGRSVRERLGLGAVGSLLAAIGGLGATQKAAVAVAAAIFALTASSSGSDHVSREWVSVRLAEAGELGTPEAQSSTRAPSSTSIQPLGSSAPVAGPRADRVALDEEAPAPPPRGGPGYGRGPGPSFEGTPPDVPLLPTSPPPLFASGGSGAGTVPDPGPPEGAGPPPQAGPKEGQGHAPEFAGPPDQAGPKDEVGGGPPPWAGPPEQAGPKEGQGNAPESAGPPDHAGPKDQAGAGPPVWAGPPPGVESPANAQAQGNSGDGSAAPGNSATVPINGGIPENSGNAAANAAAPAGSGNTSANGMPGSSGNTHANAAAGSGGPGQSNANTDNGPSSGGSAHGRRAKK